MYSSDLFAASFTGIFGLLICCIYLFGFLLGLFLVIHWIWMLVDIVTRKDSDFGGAIKDSPRLIWLLLVVLTGSIGSLIYYFAVYRRYSKS